MAKIPHRLYLTEDQMPKQWYNLRADMKEQPDPIINPATMQPAVEEDLYPVFCKKAGASGDGCPNTFHRYTGAGSGDV